MVEKGIRLDTLIFLSTLQIVVCNPDKSGRAIAFGSAFLLLHKGHLFFVTADHNLHLDDHGSKNEGQRTSKDYEIQIITNNKCSNELCSINQPIGGFFHLTGYNFEGLSDANPEKFLSVFNKLLNRTIDVNDESIPIDIRIPVLPDMAISEIDKPFQIPLLSNEVVVEAGTTIIKDGTPKLTLDTKYIIDFDERGTYIVGGTINNHIKNAVLLNRTNVIHGDLKFIKYDREKNVILHTPEPQSSDMTIWAGLSGAPVFNDNGLLVGMLIQATPSAQEITVIPIKKIIWFLEKIICFNK